jgi:hypothetical protein
MAESCPYSAWCGPRLQDFVGGVNLHRTPRALHMSFSEPLAEVEDEKGRDGGFLDVGLYVP